MFGNTKNYINFQYEKSGVEVATVKIRGVGVEIQEVRLVGNRFAYHLTYLLHIVSPLFFFLWLTDFLRGAKAMSNKIKIKFLNSTMSVK